MRPCVFFRDGFTKTLKDPLNREKFLKIKYHLKCKNCDLDHVHETDNFENLDKFWKNWNDSHGELMKCVHEYVIKKMA